ncbi:hypothetical protein, partial [Acinetobacter baumannii]|uniref:hypothetical protein n=1 Tax=Acinetobacter baumannii TaxID=470 RepID=UPI003D6B08C6
AQPGSSEGASSKDGDSESSAPQPDGGSESKPDSKEDEKEEPPIVTHHELLVSGKLLRYRVTTGFLPIMSAEGEVEARMFYMAYTLE